MGPLTKESQWTLWALLKGPKKGNEYIVVMQDHFTKWVEGRAICGKEALTVADAIVQDWVLKHGAPISLHSDRG